MACEVVGQGDFDVEVVDPSNLAKDEGTLDEFLHRCKWL
jgi:hypothetical protein